MAPRHRFKFFPGLLVTHLWGLETLTTHEFLDAHIFNDVHGAMVALQFLD